MSAGVTEGRFQFGENWRRFLGTVDEERIIEAEESLSAKLGDLEGRTFLDIGNGSGLFSLAARRLGARVHSFDYDPASVACAETLRERYRPGDAGWTIERGDALDVAYIQSLGKFDIVYSWGVLHHTGQMWDALKNATLPVRPGGLLYIAIYNDQGWASRAWWWVKRAYVATPELLRPLIVLPVLVRLWAKRVVLDLLRGHPFAQWRRHHRKRGMSAWYDIVDFAGGYPYEYATAAVIVEYYRRLGFVAQVVVDRGPTDLGCNEFVFRNSDPTAAG